MPPRKRQFVSEKTGYCTIQPTAAERWIHWCLWGALILFWIWVAPIQSFLLPSTISWQGPTKIALAVVLVAIAAAGVALFFRNRRALRAGGLLLCPRCRHPLVADSEENISRCPECGYRNHTQLVRDAWEARYCVRLNHLRTADDRQITPDPPPSRGRRPHRQ